MPAREFLNAHQQAMLKDLHLTCAPGKSVLSVLQIKQELEVRKTWTATLRPCACLPAIFGQSLVAIEPNYQLSVCIIS